MVLFGSYVYEVGFTDLWFRRVMAMVNTMWYWISHGSDDSNPIIPSHGLRQRDPLYISIFIHNLCSGSLCNFEETTSAGLIHGAKIVRFVPQITHLLFVDNSLFFTRANVVEAAWLKYCLKLYE